MNMEEKVGFSLESQTKPINEELVITYKPASNMRIYTYKVYLNDVLYKTDTINGKESTSIILDKTGTYEICVHVDFNDGIDYITCSGKYIIDKEPPKLNVGDLKVDLQLGDELIVMGGVSAKDNLDGDVTNKVTTNIDELDLITVGKKRLTYTVEDTAGNSVSKTVIINVIKDDSTMFFLIQSAIILVLLAVMFAIMIYRRSLNLEKRVSKYTIEPLKETTVSLFDKMSKLYIALIKKITVLLKKSVFITNYSNRYNKYVNIVNGVYNTGLDFIAEKIIIALLLLAIAVFSKTINLDILRWYEFYLPLTIGFLAPNTIYIYKYRKYRKKIENDLLQAIIVMNNAFKSGRSILQAVQLVTTELDGPIAEEYKKMYLELSYGLGVDVVFSRFSQRINLEEIAYLTASLTVLNKTGGNIIKVFSSIEKSLFSKKKLKLELATLTGTSKLVLIALFLVPILFIIFVSIVSPGYFIPFISKPIGFVLLSIMIIFYIVYVIVISRIMKVRM